MACGSCEKELAALRDRVVELEAALDTLGEAHLELAKLFDREVGHDEEEESEEG